MPDPEEAPAEVLRPQSDWELLGHDHSNGDPRVVVKDPATGERVKIPVAEWSSIRDGSTSPESPEATDPPEEVEALGDIATVATTEVNPPPPVASGGEGTPPAGPPGGGGEGPPAPPEEPPGDAPEGTSEKLKEHISNLSKQMETLEEELGKAKQMLAEISENTPEKYLQELMTEYAAAVKDGSARDLSFNQWEKDRREREAANWRTMTRPLTEYGSSNDDAYREARRNAAEGGPKPTLDDIRYFQWQQEQANAGNGGDAGDAGDADEADEADDGGMDRLKEHFANLDVGDEPDDEEEPPGPPDPPGPPGPPRPPEPRPPIDPSERFEKNARTLEEALAASRAKLAEIVIRRKARAGDGQWVGNIGGREEDVAAYNEALQEWIAATELSAGHLREKLEAEGLDGEEIIKLQALFVFEEQRKLATEETQLSRDNLDDEIKKGNWLRSKSLKLLRWWAHQRTRKKLVIGVGVGLAGTVLAGSTAGLGLAGLAVGSAAKFSLGLVNRRASLRNVSQQSYEQRLSAIKSEYDRNFTEEIAGILGDNPALLESALVSYSGSAEQSLDKDIKRAQLRNKIGNGVLILSGTTLGLDALGGAGFIPGIHGIFGGGGHHAAESSQGPGGGITHHNIEFAGPDRITGVNLPQGMDLIRSANGHLAIYDTVNHHEILNGGSLPKGLFDRQGNLSVVGREFFTSRGLTLDDATKLAGRFMTTITGQGG